MKPILIINDLHIPFQRDDILTYIEQCKDDVDTIIFGGDLIDCKSISVFPDLDDITIEEELEAAILFVKKVREIVGPYTRLIAIKGNHEIRWEKYISKMHDKKLYKFINPNILEMLRDGMSVYCNGEVKRLSGDSQLIVVNDWWINFSGVIVCHPINFYAQPTRLASSAVQFFQAKGQIFNCLIAAHSHHQSMCFCGSVWAIESGCCCKEMDYVQGKTTAKAQDYGFVYLTFDKNDRVDVNNSFIHKLESAN